VAFVKRLLRNVIDFQDGRASKEALQVNYQRLQASTIEWAQPVDEKIFKFIREFFLNNFELPTAQTIEDFFTRSDDIEVTERLKDIKASETYVHRNYAHLLGQLVEDQNRIKMRALLKDAEEIVSKGRILQENKEKVRVQGVKDALLYLTRRAHDLIPVEVQSRTSGDLREDTAEAWQEYQTSKNERGTVWGAFAGINEIDKVCRGCKRGELWVHAAFVGELKTTFALNWAYNLITRYRTNVLYVSLEMPYKQIRRNIYAIHTSNKKWSAQGKKPLDLRQIRDGELTPEEEAFYQEALADFNTNTEYCRFEVWSPDNNVTIEDIRVKAELLHKQMDIGLIVIDHGGLVEPTKNNKDHTIELNSVLRGAKKTLALHFNGGEGVPVLMLFQINRQGKEDADKAEGRYKIKALSYANEAEKSADYITTTYLNDQHRENGTTLFCNLKNRDNPLFAPFTASVDFKCRRIMNFDPTISRVAGMRVDTPDGSDALLDGV
jgi:replicative DNA helicase